MEWNLSLPSREMRLREAGVIPLLEPKESDAPRPGSGMRRLVPSRVRDRFVKRDVDTLKRELQTIGGTPRSFLDGASALDTASEAWLDARDG